MITGYVLILILILCNQIRTSLSLFRYLLASLLSSYALFAFYVHEHEHVHTCISHIYRIRGVCCVGNSNRRKAENSILTAAPISFVVLVVDVVVFVATTTIQHPYTVAAAATAVVIIVLVAVNVPTTTIPVLPWNVSQFFIGRISVLFLSFLFISTHGLRCLYGSVDFPNRFHSKIFLQILIYSFNSKNRCRLQIM